MSGEKVSIVWGRSKKAYNAEVVDDGSSFGVPQQAIRTAAEEDDGFGTCRSCPNTNRKTFTPVQRASFDTEDGQPSGCCDRTGSQSYMPLSQ